MENITIVTDNVFGSVEVISCGVLLNIESKVTFNIRNLIIHVDFENDPKQDGVVHKIPIEKIGDNEVVYTVINSNQAAAGTILSPYPIGQLDGHDLLINLAIFYSPLYESRTIHYAFYRVI